MMKKPSALDWIALILLVVGGLNWGLVGLLHLDLVATIFGVSTTIARIVYVLVGLSAIYVLVRSLMCGKSCQQNPAA
jgi:uncharacterized membrane protein YuzA (DUF378 family)